MDIALEHRTDDPAAAGRPLIEEALPHDGLFSRILAGVGVTAIDHHGWVQAALLKSGAGGSDVLGSVVSSRATASKDEVAVWISRRLDNARRSILVDSKKTVGRV